MESVGFKEWALVCDAIARGKQSVIIRKGGIAEGRDGFSFRHREFFLVPTWFHEQVDKVRGTDIELPPQDETTITIEVFARIDEVRVVTDIEQAVALEPLHILERNVVRERFDYADNPGVHVAFIRAFRLQLPWRLPNEKRYGGCRSWLTLPEPPADLRLEPVLSEADHAERRALFLQITASANAPT